MVMILLRITTSLLQTDNCGQHSCYQRSIARVSDPEDISARDRQRPARLDNFGAGQKRFALGWSQ
jgi:hypothetical protein